MGTHLENLRGMLRGLALLRVASSSVAAASVATGVAAVASTGASRWMTLAANKKYINGRKVDPASQPKPSNAEELIAEVPPVEIKGRRAVCDGGGGALGHPKVFINLDANRPVECPYCGIRFVQIH